MKFQQLSCIVHWVAPTLLWDRQEISVSEFLPVLVKVS